ncbi:hypothetical protein ACFWFU_03375 [Streptomyces sp. NPDC060235]
MTTTTACRGVPARLLHIPDLVARLSTEDRGGDWQLPAYDEAHAA